MAPLLFISSAMAWFPRTRTRATPSPVDRAVAFGARNVLAVRLPELLIPPSSVALEIATVVASMSSKTPEAAAVP